MAKQNSQSKSRIIFGYILISFAILALVLTVIPNWAITKLALGTFGIVWYAYLLLILLFGIANVLALKFAYTKKFTVFLSLSIFMLICLLHVIFSNAAIVENQGFENFKNYLSICFNMTTGITVGGAFVGVITYAVRAIFGIVGVYAIFVMLLSIFFGITLDKIIYGTNKKAKPMQKIKFKPAEIQETANEKSALEYEMEKISKEPEYEEFEKPEPKTSAIDIFYPTEQSTNIFDEQDQNIRRQRAKSMLFDRDSVPDITIESDAERDRWMKNYRDENNEPQDLRREPDDLSDLFGHNTIDEPRGRISRRIAQDDEQEDRLSRISQNDDDFEPISRGEGLGRVPGRINSRETQPETQRVNIFDDPEPHSLGANEPDRAKPVNLQQKPAVDAWSRPKPTKKENNDQLGMKNVRYNAIPLTIFAERKEVNADYSAEQHQKAAALEKVMSEFGVNAKVINVVRGPKVTRYELSLPTGVSTAKVTSIQSNISMALMSRTPVRIEAPIPGKNAVGIELENDKTSAVSMRELLESPEFIKFKDPLPIAIGKDISGSVIIKSLPKMVHLLVAGSTGSGKSIFIHAVMMSILYKYSPEDVRFVMIDPKRVEFSMYSNLPHLILPDVLCDHDKALNALKWVVGEMERRFSFLQENEVQNIEQYNKLPDIVAKKVQKMPYIVVVVDELAELMCGALKKDFELAIQRITQLGRACGIHMVVATQRPSVDVVTGTIKNNFPTRVAFRVKSFVDSKTVLDEAGAESLLGAGDMLFAPQDSNALIRLQAAYCTNEEIRSALKYVKENNIAEYSDEIAGAINAVKTENNAEGGDSGDGGEPSTENGRDPLLKPVCQFARINGKVSTSLLQRKFRIGFGRAARIVDELVDLGFAGPSNGSKPRDFVMTDEQFEEMFGQDDDSNDEF